jgi:flagellar basal body-associated protein FliL
MEQNMQSSENNMEIKLDSEGEPISPKPEKKINKKIVLLIIIILVVIGFGAVYFLFLNKGDNDKLSINDDVAVLEDKKEVEIDKELDSDQDGLPDYIEKILGTDINNSDTDGD